MKVFFRCDSSFEIGSGHVMRCLTLAQYLQAVHIQSEFICKSLAGNFINEIKEQGFKVHVLEDKNLTQSEDAKLSKDFIEKNAPIIVDSYNLNHEWESCFYNDNTIMAIDDLGRKHQVHALLDNNFRLDYQTVYQNQAPKDCKLFLGPQYALLRKDFLETHKQKIARKENTVLVFFGGTDSTGETLSFLKSLMQIPNPLTWNIVVTTHNKFLNEVKNLTLPENIKLLVQPQSMATLMSQNSYYFGSGGSITWERLYMGLIGSVVSVADNQVELSENLAQTGLQPYLGHIHKNAHKKYVEHVQDQLLQKDLLAERRAKSMAMVRAFPLEDLKKIFNK